MRSGEERARDGARNDDPGQGRHTERHEDRGASEVLGVTGQRVDLGAEAVDRGLDGAVENLDERHEERRLHEYELLEGGDRKTHRKRNEHRAKEHLFAEGGFFFPGGGKPCIE